MMILNFYRQFIAPNVVEKAPVQEHKCGRMILKSYEESNKYPRNFRKYISEDGDGHYRFDSQGYFENEHNTKLDWNWKRRNETFEKVFNGPQLYECNRCGILDTKENLDRGVEHSRIQCEEESYYYQIWLKLSQRCRNNPEYYLSELLEAKKNTQFQDSELYSSNFELRYHSDDIISAFEIPLYIGNNVVSDDWKTKYRRAINLAKSNQLI